MRTLWMGGNKDSDRYDDYDDGRGYGYPGGLAMVVRPIMAWILGRRFFI